MQQDFEVQQPEVVLVSTFSTASCLFPPQTTAAAKMDCKTWVLTALPDLVQNENRVLCYSFYVLVCLYWFGIQMSLFSATLETLHLTLVYGHKIVPEGLKLSPFGDNKSIICKVVKLAAVKISFVLQWDCGIRFFTRSATACRANRG